MSLGQWQSWIVGNPQRTDRRATFAEIYQWRQDHGLECDMDGIGQTSSAAGGMPPRIDTLPNVEIFGIKVHGPTLDQALSIMDNWIQHPDGRCRQVIVTGFHGLWVAHEEPAYRRLLNGSDLFIPDGIAPVWLSHLHGRPLPERTPGPALMEAFFRRAQTTGYTSYFYGDKDDTLEGLRARIAYRFPGTRVAGAFSPPFRALSEEEEADHVAAINESRADVLWVGLGLPKQDQWIARNLHRLNVKVALGVGAAFAFHAGKVSRAPQWLGDAGFEWVWRLATEPKKMWKRDFKDGPRFVLAALSDAVLTRARGVYRRSRMQTFDE